MNKYINISIYMNGKGLVAPFLCSPGPPAQASWDAFPPYPLAPRPGTRAPGPVCKEMLLPTLFHSYILFYLYNHSFIFFYIHMNIYIYIYIYILFRWIYSCISLLIHIYIYIYTRIYTYIQIYMFLS